jgi:hypothetical protein
VVKGHRVTLERELLWNIALDGDPARREQLNRMLSPAANDPVTVVSPVEPARPTSEEMK